MDNYLEILEESLKQKVLLLDKIAEHCMEQEALLKGESMSLEKFDEYVEKKDILIQKLTRLDEGFESLYARVSEQLSGSKAAYAAQIKRMQTLIEQITEKSVSIQAREARNKQLIEAYFATERKTIQQGRRNTKAAYDYYQKLSKSNQTDFGSVDWKQ